jgi:plasmid stabilization system protein ParE
VARIRLLGDASRSITAVLAHSLEAFGEEAANRYAALIRQAISDFAAAPSAPGVRRIGSPRQGKILLRYDLETSQNGVPSGACRVATPRHFIVGRLEGDLLRILFVAHDRMKPENVLRRSRQSDIRDD